MQIVSNSMKLSFAALALCLSAVTACWAQAVSELPSFKDDLFANRILEERGGGSYRVIDYDEMRDINGRDAVPERRVQRKYIDLSVKRQEVRATLQTSAGPVPFIATGRLDNASIITIFLHGQGGNEELGSRDLIFGGNFNRIRNLMVRAGGLYVTPTFRDFGQTGADQVAALIASLAERSPGASILLACASMGGYICHRLEGRADTIEDLSGLLYLGAPPSAQFTDSQAFRARLPVYIGHGSRDPVFPMQSAEGLYASVKNASANYPVRIDRYETGNHGTPIRMIDWRTTINWILKSR